MNKIRDYVRESANRIRIIYIILVLTAQTGLQSRQYRLYSTVCIESILLILLAYSCLLYTSPSPRDKRQSRMPSSA